jgi:hypothetical protein
MTSMKVIAIAMCFCILAGCNSSENEKTSSTGADTTGSAETAPTAMPVSQTDSADNKLSPAEESEGFRLLFDGRSKDNFHVFNNAADGSAWKVVDGTLHLDPKEKGAR